MNEDEFILVYPNPIFLPTLSKTINTNENKKNVMCMKNSVRITIII